MSTIALQNKEILDYSELYLNENIDNNLASSLLGKVTSLPRSGRLHYEVDWNAQQRIVQNRKDGIPADSKSFVG